MDVDGRPSTSPASHSQSSAAARPGAAACEWAGDRTSRLRAADSSLGKRHCSCQRPSHPSHQRGCKGRHCNHCNHCNLRHGNLRQCVRSPRLCSALRLQSALVPGLERREPSPHCPGRRRSSAHLEASIVAPCVAPTVNLGSAQLYWDDTGQLTEPLSWPAAQRHPAHAPLVSVRRALHVPHQDWPHPTAHWTGGRSRAASVPSSSGCPNTTTVPTRTLCCHFTFACTALESSRRSLSRQCRQVSMKRKRTSRAGGPRKKAHLAGQSANATPAAAIEQPVLQRFYPRLLTLRHYLLSALPKSSRNRRRKLAQLGLPIAPNQAAASTCSPDVELGQLLDLTVIGEHKTAKVEDEEQLAKERSRDIESFTQQLSPAITGASFRPGSFMQSEVGPKRGFIVIKRIIRAGAKRHRLCTS